MGEECTTWDLNRQQYVLSYFRKVPQELRSLRQRLKSSYSSNMDSTIMDIVNELHRVIGEINSLSNLMHVQDEWPELLLTLSAGGKQIGFCHLNAKHFLSLQKREVNQASNHCWRMKSFFFKSSSCSHTCSNCGCNAGLVLGCIAIVLESERHEFLSRIAGEWSSPSPYTWLPNVGQTFFRCHIYVHQAKIRPGSDNKVECDGYVRVIFASQVAETDTAKSICSPIWDAVITVNGVSLPGGVSWYLQNPPLLGLELFNCQQESVGTGQIKANVITADQSDESSRGDESKYLAQGTLQRLKTLRNVSPPPLKWVSIAKNGRVQAELLMSVELKQLVGDTQIFEYKEPELTAGIPPSIRPNMLNYV